MISIVIGIVGAGFIGFAVGYENGWRTGRLQGRAEILRDRSRR